MSWKNILWLSLTMLVFTFSGCETRFVAIERCQSEGFKGVAYNGHSWKPYCSNGEVEGNCITTEGGKFCGDVLFYK
jgi:hypothetical protein